jgi:replicative DNA helicase
MKMDEGVSGVPSGFRDLDKITSGWQKSDMIVIAARPGMGKTAFVLSMARNIAVDHGRPVAIFSLEMASIQLVQRLISSETEISSEKLRKGNLRDDEFAQLHARIGKLSKAPLFIDDTPALSVFELRAKCRRLKQQHNIELIIIDYLQLMTAGSDKGNREQEISTISRSIKSIAKELNVPVIALSQLNRSVETRGGDKKPQLSDLRESGAIEQDADLVSFIYRPEYYGITEYEDGMPTHGVGEFIVAKHRNGALDSVKLSFRGELAKFGNLESFNFNEPLDPLNPDTGFAEAGPTITMPSKMNDEWDKDEDDAPF